MNDLLSFPRYIPVLQKSVHTSHKTVQELEDELKENNMKWDVIGLGEVRRKEESFTTLQSGHLLYHSEANHEQAGIGFLIYNKWKDNITRVSSGSSRVAELVLRITGRYQLKIVQVFAPTTSHSDEETYNFYNTIDKILEKQTHYTIVMGDFNAKVGGQTNTSERATGCFGLGQRNERGDTLVELATSNNFKIMNTQFQKKAGTWRSPDGNNKTEIDYIMTDKPNMVTDMTVINRVNIGSDCNVIVLYIMVARNTIYEFLIHSGLMIQPVPTENNMSRLNSRGPLICSAAI